MSNSVEDVVSIVLYVLFVALLVALSLGFYFLPSIIGWRRRIRNLRPLIILNLLGGWCLIAWGLAIVVAIRNPTRDAFA